MSFVTDLFKKPKEPDYNQMKFSPYSISGPLGGVKFDTGAKTATLNLEPDVQALLDVYFKGAKDFLPSPAQTQFATDIGAYGTKLFGEATGRDLNTQIADEYKRQLKLLEPERAQEDVRLREQLYGTGRSGLATSAGGGYINPEIFSQQFAREQTNLGLLGDIDALMRNRQYEDIQKGISLQGMSDELRMNPYAQSYGLFSQAASIPGLLESYIGPGISAGGAGATAGANIVNAQNQRYQSQLGFWGNLFGAAGSFLGGKSSGGSDGLFSSFSSPFASAPAKVGSTDFWKGTPSFSWSSPSTWF